MLHLETPCTRTLQSTPPHAPQTSLQSHFQQPPPLSQNSCAQVGPKFPPLTSGDGPLKYEEVVQRLDAAMDWIAGLYTNTMNVRGWGGGWNGGQEWVGGDLGSERRQGGGRLGVGLIPTL
jgi:hypothetical protein